MNHGVVLAGVLGGLLSGLLGIGGGTVIVPVLIYAAGYDQLTAQGTSLAGLLLPVGLLAAIKYHKHGHVRVHDGITLAVCLFVSARVGAHYAHQLPVETIKQLFGVLLIVAGVKNLG